jgi:GNAT superfamily N-acetyltransferase
MADPAYDSLLFEYATECSIPEIGPINPQAEIYAAMEYSGGMQAFGAFHGERLVGFATVLVYVIPHYGQKAASFESLFVPVEYRATAAGADLIDIVRSFARDMGCKVLFYNATVGGRLEKLLRAHSRSGRRRIRQTHSAFTEVL